MHKEQKINPEDQIMKLIHERKVTMRPRWYFVVGSMLSVGGFASLFVTVLFLLNIFLFAVNSRGGFGSFRFAMLLDSFPWWTIPLAIIGIIFGVALLRKQDILYRKNPLLVVSAIIVTIILAAVILSVTGLDQVLFHRGPLRTIYDSYGPMMDGSGPHGRGGMMQGGRGRMFSQ